MVKLAAVEIHEASCHVARQLSTDMLIGAPSFSQYTMNVPSEMHPRSCHPKSMFLAVTPLLVGLAVAYNQYTVLTSPAGMSSLLVSVSHASPMTQRDSAVLVEKLHGFELFRSEQSKDSLSDYWELHPGVELKPQKGGSYADKNDGYWNDVFVAKSIEECSGRAQDDGLSMFVYNFKKQLCKVSQRAPQINTPEGKAALSGSAKAQAEHIVSGTTKWKPNFNSGGMLSYGDPPGGGAETSIMRFKGKVYVMESVEGHDEVSPELQSAFRIRDFRTGDVLAEVSEANGHAFFSGSVDHERGVAWVYGSAHKRGAGDDADCDPKVFNDGKHRCYVGAWTSTDMIHWSETKKVLYVPENTWVGNVAVAMVSGDKYDTAALGSGIKAVMALEYCDNQHCEKSSMENRYCFAVNTGAAGSLESSWHVLSNQFCPVGMHSCPSLNYDASEGYFYMTGGGSRINGPDRSRDLIHWERSPLHPASRPATDLIAPYDNFQSQFYRNVWKRTPGKAFGSKWSATELLSPHWMSKWNWGHSDMDFCCNDGEPGSYAVYLSSAQSHPNRYVRDGKRVDSDIPWPSYVGLAQFNGSLNQWMRSYFPSPGATYCGATNVEDC
eukprot:SAG31_NODE_2566_length_5466_cov_6.677846_3_plen_608_part_00